MNNCAGKQKDAQNGDGSYANDQDPGIFFYG
jgi:hypothetical protein